MTAIIVAVKATGSKKSYGKTMEPIEEYRDCAPEVAFLKV